MHRSTLARRRMLAALALSAAVPALHAQEAFPSKPIHLLIPYAAGGIGDSVGRLLAANMTEVLGQQVVVENPAGGNAIPGTLAAARAAPDGYTILQVTSAQIVNMVLREKNPYDLQRDFAPVARSSLSPLVLAVPASSTARTVADLVSQSKAKAGGATYGSGGVGSIGHLSAEVFRLATGMSGVHVPYKGNVLVVQDLLAGRLDFAFLGQADAIAHVNSGKLRALAVPTQARVPVMPDVPTLAEAGWKGIELSFTYGYLVPRGTPEPVIRTLHDAMIKAMAQPALKERMAAMGLTMIPGGPSDYAETITAELQRWGKVIRDANIKVE